LGTVNAEGRDINPTGFTGSTGFVCVGFPEGSRHSSSAWGAHRNVHFVHGALIVYQSLPDAVQKARPFFNQDLRLSCTGAAGAGFFSFAVRAKLKTKIL
jgi:hypothetical protein